MVDLSIIIVNWNVKAYLLECLQSIEDTIVPMNAETIVIDIISRTDPSRLFERGFRASS